MLPTTITTLRQTKLYAPSDEPRELKVPNDIQQEVEIEKTQKQLNQLCSTLKTQIDEYSEAKDWAEKQLRYMEILFSISVNKEDDNQHLEFPPAWVKWRTHKMEEIAKCASQLGLRHSFEYYDLFTIFGLTGTLQLMQQEHQRRVTRHAMDHSFQLWENALTTAIEIKRALGYEPHSFKITDVQTDCPFVHACIECLMEFELTYKHPAPEGRFNSLLTQRSIELRLIAGLLWREPRWLW